MRVIRNGRCMVRRAGGAGHSPARPTDAGSNRSVGCAEHGSSWPTLQKHHQMIRQPIPESCPGESPMFRRSLVLGLTCTGLLAAVGGCQSRRPRVAPSEPPVVPVSQPVRREVTDYVDFTGRTEAVHSVDVRPRVTGYLVEMPFQEGAEVKKGD